MHQELSLHDQSKQWLRTEEGQYVLGKDACEQKALEKTFPLKKSLEKIPGGHPDTLIPKTQQTYETREQMSH